MQWNDVSTLPNHNRTVLVWLEPEPLKEEGYWDLAYYSSTYKRWVKTPEDIFCEPTHWMEVIGPSEE